MANVMAAMLDELMGRDRNLAPGDKNRGIKWDDKRVCKYFLCGICPHELFTNTKSDLGPCDKIHDDELKDQFNKAPTYQRAYIEDDFERMIEGHIRDCDKRIARGNDRLKLSREQDGPAPMVENDRTRMLTAKINELMDKAEQLGCQGRVEEAQGMTRMCEQLKIERQQVSNEASGIAPIVMASLKDEKLMEVCAICGVFLIIGDAQSRIDDHLNGKQHIGYAKLRTCLAERREARNKAREERDKSKAEADAERAKKREERDKSRERSSGRRGGGERDKERDRDRNDKDRERDRDRDRSDKDKDRRRSRSRERGKSSTSDRSGGGGGKRATSSERDRGARPAERSGGGDRRRSRSRDRDRDRQRDHRRDNNRDRRRSRSRERDHRPSVGGGDRRRSSRSRSRDRRRDRSRSRSRDRKREREGGDARNPPKREDDDRKKDDDKNDSGKNDDEKSPIKSANDKDLKETDKDPKETDKDASENPPAAAPTSDDTADTVIQNDS